VSKKPKTKEFVLLRDNNGKPELAKPLTVRMSVQPPPLPKNKSRMEGYQWVVAEPCSYPANTSHTDVYGCDGIVMRCFKLVPPNKKG
jgi:hypothetical protein